MHISVNALFRNNADYVQHFAALFQRVENAYRGRIQFSYYFYENNSDDATKERLLHFLKARPGALYSENLAAPSPMMTGISIQRGARMAQLRNRLKHLHGQLHGDFTLCIDSDVLFHESAIGKLLGRVLGSSGAIAMVTPFCICWVDHTTQQQQNTPPDQRSYHYYDSLAFIADDGTAFSHNGNTCMFESCRRCITQRKIEGFSHIDHQQKLLPIRGHAIPVRAAFGGTCLLRTAIYNRVAWGDSVCEHHTFCERVRKHGQIVCDTTVPTVVTCTPRIAPSDYKEMQLLVDALGSKPFSPSPQQQQQHPGA